MKEPNPRQVIDLLCMSLWDSNGDLIDRIDRDHELWPVWLSFNVERVEMGWRGPGGRTTARVQIGGGPPPTNKGVDDLTADLTHRITLYAMPFASNRPDSGVYHGWGLQLATEADDLIYLRTLGSKR